MARAPPLHAAGPVFGGPSSAGRVRPSGSSLNGCENGSNGPINGDDELLFERKWLWLWWVSVLIAICCKHRFFRVSQLQISAATAQDVGVFRLLS